MADSWRNWTDANKIIERLKQLKTVMRAEVLENFARKAIDEDSFQLFKDIIKSDYFTKEYIIRYLDYPSKYSSWARPEIIEFLKDYVSELLDDKNISWEEEDWREEVVPEKIMWHATPQNKWEILEYFAEHDARIFYSIVNGEYTKAIYSTNKTEFFSKMEIIKHYADVKEEDIPKELYRYLQQSKAYFEEYERQKAERAEKRKEDSKRKREERLLSWEDENGNIIELFKLNARALKSREEYLTVCKKFLDSDLTMKGFCAKYLVSSTEGFRKMLEKFSAEDENLAKEIQTKMAFGQTQYVSFAKKLIAGVVKGELDYSEIIKSVKTYNLQDMLTLCENLFSSQPKVKDIFLMRTIQYFYDRINSIKDMTDPQYLAQLLTTDEIKYILEDYQYRKLMKGEKIDVGQEFFNKVKVISTSQPQLMRSCVNGKNRIREVLSSKYSDRFSWKHYFKNANEIATEGGKTVQVTEEMVEQAYEFAKSHNLFRGEVSLKYIIRAVALGKIQNKEETAQFKRNEISNLYSLLDEYINLTQYFETVERINSLDN